MGRLGRVLTVALVVALFSSAVSCSSSSTQSSAGPGGTITIAVDLPLSGADASDGNPAVNGVKLAIKDANDSQLVSGFTLALDVRDDTVNGVHNVGKGESNFRAFIAEPSVLGVIGPLNSNVAQTLIPISNAEGLALISPANTSPELTKGPQALALRKDHPLEITYFRVCPTDDEQGSAGATFAYKSLGARKAYVMDDNQTFGRGISDQWASQFRSEGGVILGHDHARPGQTDFHDMIGRASASGADIIFFGGESSTGAAVARKQMANSPLAHSIYESGDGIQNQQFLDVTGAEAENSYATVALANAMELPTASTFVKEYEAEYGQQPVGYSPGGYVAAMVLIEAIAKAAQANHGKMPSRAQVLEQVRNTTNFNSILGMFSFDQNGDTTLKIVSVWRVKKHHWTFLTQKEFKT
jgi:branched-chain amino acid transport system substrate-binding protein